MRVRTVLESVLAAGALSAGLVALAPTAPAVAQSTGPSQRTCTAIANGFVDGIENARSDPSDIAAVQVLLDTGERVLAAAGCPSGYDALLLEAAAGGSGGGTPA